MRGCALPGLSCATNEPPSFISSPTLVLTCGDAPSTYALGLQPGLCPGFSSQLTGCADHLEPPAAACPPACCPAGASQVFRSV